MIFRRIWCDVGDLIYGCTLLLVLATANSIREYDNPCNETLYIGGSSYTQAGVIKFGFDPTFLNKSYSCKVTIETGIGRKIRAMSIFALQLATRGVDGRDNRAYTEDGEPIDMSLAEPPPEYSSLENIERVGETSETNDVTSADLPPTYEEAIRNRDHYKIESDDVTVI
ncbi:hypothetical protein MAR_002152 [Mya arenaria]|uniref:CUB domain-containing protein n=1 Tax=Mya arenaria TaxID=6604 RepID=A0ABY7FHG0_MYAAR|nr:hypothetical protein MAR_002152 [Mya arenaria]